MKLRADPDKGTRSHPVAVAGAAGPVRRGDEAMVRLVLGAYARPRPKLADVHKVS